MEEKIRIFATGGTFDKEYNELTENLVFKEGHVQEMLLKGRSDVVVDVRTLMMIDSLHMTDLHRESIADQCSMCEEERILVTHGTGTMVETAAVVAGRHLDKTIVFTGAMIPFVFGSSDGLFNLGSALAFVQVLEPGVYVCMNGRYFLWNLVKKNTETGHFESLVKPL